MNGIPFVAVGLSSLTKILGVHFSYKVFSATIEKMMDWQNVSESAKDLWNEWEIRGMILISLSLQIFLIIFGKQRQYTATTLIRNLVWLAYLAADSVATISLSIISRSQGDSKMDSANLNNALLAFWAPFLLLHLGGPDTITAFALEDNELWKRHLLQLVTQVGIAFYVLGRFWSSNALIFVAIPIFVAGIIKYAERNWVLRYASAQQLRDSSYLHRADQMELDLYEWSHNESDREINEILDFNNIINEAKYLNEAYFLFQMFLRFYSGVIVSLSLHKATYKIIENKTSVEAFKLIEVELGFMFDWLYTKAPIIHLPLVAIFRSISYLSSISALTAFSIIIHKQSYIAIDKTISYLLLIGSIVLEVYAVLVFLFSDWAMLWLSKQRESLVYSIFRGIYFNLHFLINQKRWAESMAQFNFIGHYFLKKSTNSLKFEVGELLGFHEERENVNEGLKTLIFTQLQEKRKQCKDNEHYLNGVKKLLTHWGKGVLERYGISDEFDWSVAQVDFHHSLLSWHIATDLCYHVDGDGKDVNNLNSNCKMSKALSEYMAYLLFRHPFMLPRGIGELRCHETMKEAADIFSKVSSRSEAYKELLQDENLWRFLQVEHEEDQGKLSALFDGCRLARSLQSLEANETWTNGKKWEMISEMWVEILTYAASQCGWREHAQQLSQGGELLTHVSLLMAHLGLSEQCWDEIMPYIPLIKI